MINRLNIARTLIILGFIAGLGSLTATFAHIGDPAYLVSPEFSGGRAHSWYHALREVFGDLSAILVILFVFFGPPRYRQPITWWICLILMLGYYLPFWAGMPFVEELRAPNLQAEFNHISQALLALSGLLYGRREFFLKP